LTLDRPRFLPAAAQALELIAQPLTADAFAAFGDVIESGCRAPLSINAGMTQRHHDLARVDLGPDGGRTLVNIFETLPYPLPLRVAMLERHPLGSQAFVPMDGSSFLVVVAPAGDAVRVEDVRAFVTNGRQGVNYARGVWHHPLVVTQRPASFVVVDRGGAGHNCDEIHLPRETALTVSLR
jgi:ureidoglycolate lyase